MLGNFCNHSPLHPWTPPLVGARSLLALGQWPMGINSAPFSFADCVCCPPGTIKKTVTRSIALPSNSRHAFLRVVQHLKLPREVLLRIFALAVAVERHVVNSCPPAASRRDKLSEPPGDRDPFSFSRMSMCLESEDAPP